MNDILNKLHEAAASPRAQMDGYLVLDNSGKNGSCHGNTRGWSVFWHCSLRNVHMNIVFLEKFRFYFII